MKWLFVTSQLPWPLTNGQWLRIYYLARALRSQGDEVAVLTCSGEEEDRDIEGVAAYESLGVNFIFGISGKHSSKGRPRSLMGPYAFDDRMARAVAKHSDWADAVILSHSRMLQYSAEASRSPVVIADIGDDPTLEYGRRRQTRSNLATWGRRGIAKLGRRRYERHGLSHVHAATFVSDTDAQSFAGRHPRANIGCVANGVDVRFFQKPMDYCSGNPEPTLVFTGYMSNPNNIWAAEFLVRQVSPLIWEKRDDVRVQIVGADPTEEVRALADRRVEVSGTVSDLRPYLWDATIVALTMQSGTGIKNKLLEAWAAGAPVVATPIACQGIDASDRRNLRIAHTAEQFATTVLELLDDAEQRQQLAAEGHSTVAKNFTWGAAATRLRETVQRIGRKHPAFSPAGCS